VVDEHDGDGIDLGFVDELVRRFGTSREGAIPILQAIQSHYRYLPDEALKRVCELAYQRHLRALQSARSLRRALKGDAGVRGSDATQAGELITKAQHDLQRARRLARRCAEREGEIARRYGL